MINTLDVEKISCLLHCWQVVTREVNKHYKTVDLNEMVIMSVDALLY